MTLASVPAVGVEEARLVEEGRAAVRLLSLNRTSVPQVTRVDERVLIARLVQGVPR